MLVIADSGSTKADWMVQGDHGTQRITTMGFNPVFHPTELIFDELTRSFANQADKDSPGIVYYYGSGCWDTKRKKVISDALSKIFVRAEIKVEHDLLGAARATCGNQPGIACIIGTGSNSCLYDGEDIKDNVTNLGYLIGDEGSGTHLGKRLIRAYFYRELPHDLLEKFEKFAPEGPGHILDTIYGKETPNVYLASFTKFLGENRDNFFVQRLLYKSFTEFIDRHVRKYKGHMSLPVHFIGSIAYTFQDIIKIALEERDLKVGKFIKKPIDHLFSFHTSTDN